MALPKPAIVRAPGPREGVVDGTNHAHAHAHAALAPHGGRYDSILDAIGHTPLVEIPRMSPNPAVRIYAKLEMVNPTGSVKDRVAKYLVEDLETRGLLRADSIILEPTSGNTGIALAMIGRRKGYRVALVMPDNVTNERRLMAALFGAEVIDSPGHLGSNGAIALAKHLVSKDPRFVMPYQYGNDANPRAHEETTGPEILDATMLDAKYLVSNRDAIAALRDLVDREGIFGGPSCGAVLVAAAREARTMSSGTIVALLPDGGWKYLSAGTFSRDFDEMADDLEGGVSWW